MEERIYVFGNADETQFPSPEAFVQYIQTGIFTECAARYRYTHARNPTSIVLKLGDFLYGRFDIARRERARPEDEAEYDRAEWVYLVVRSALYAQPVPFENSGVAYQVGGVAISRETFNQIEHGAGTITYFHGI